MKAEYRAREIFGLASVAVLVFLALAAVGVPDAQGQSEDPAPDWNKPGDTLEAALGLHYGKLGGHGLAFRAPVRWWWLYVQVAGGIWDTQDHKQHNVGFQLHYLLRQDSRLRLYLAAGFSHFYDKEKTSEAGQPDVWRLEEDWNQGAGVGIEWLQGQRLSFQLEADFVHDGAKGETKLVPQAGVFFYW